MPRLSGGNLIDKAPLPKSSSQRTPRWRELDSNLPFRARAGSILPVRFVAEPNPRKRSGALLWPARSPRTQPGRHEGRAPRLPVVSDVFLRQLLIMLLTIIVHPFTCGCQQYAKRL